MVKDTDRGKPENKSKKAASAKGTPTKKTAPPKKTAGEVDNVVGASGKSTKASKPAVKKSVATKPPAGKPDIKKPPASTETVTDKPIATDKPMADSAGKRVWAGEPARKPATAAAGVVDGEDKSSESEERRRRIILTLWLTMFTVLIIVFIWVFFSLFAPGRAQLTAAKKCLQCHEKEMARQLGSQYLHEPFGKELCTNCHVEPKTPDKACDPKKRIYAVLSGTLDKVCTKCHTNAKAAMTKKFVHRPFKGKRCTDCHDPHASQFEKLTIMPEQELCVSCHYGTSFMQAFQHEPAQKRNCVDCHEPHASDEAKDLVLPVNQLCYSCHFRVAQQNLRLYKHKPFLDGNCIACHKPHSSPTAKILAYEYNTLCESCHPTIGADFQRLSHHPLGIEPMKNCGVCHLYHSADWPKLLPLENTINCYQSQCHPGLQAYFDTSEHNSTVMGMLAKQNLAVTCSACHSPHGANYTTLLTVDRYAVCLACHADKTGNPAHGTFAHPFNPPYVDTWHGDYLWCGSCHNFHGSPYPAMRLALGDDLCLKCHNPSDLESTFR